MQPEAPQTNQQLRDIFRRIRRALTTHPFRKVAALLLAAIFWMIIIASDPDLTVEMTFMNVPISVTNQDTLRNSKGLVVTDDLATGTITARMRVEVKRQYLDTATADKFQPRLDLSQVTQAGRQEVLFSAGSTAIGNVLSFEPASVTINVETYESRGRIPVDVEQVGEFSVPLWITNILTDPAQVTVAGPKSLVDQVNRAVVQLPRNGLSESRQQDRLIAILELRDANDKPVASPLLRITNDGVTIDSVNILANVYPMIDVPVNADRAVTGIPAHGYEVTGIRVVPDQVGVAAERAVLSEIEWLYVQSAVDVSGMTESTTVPVALRSIVGTQYVAATEVVVEVDIGPARHQHTYINLPVIVMGMDPALDYRLSHTEMDVFIQGDYDQVQGLGAQDITLYVDAAGLGAGVHQLDVQCIVNGTDDFAFEPELPRLTLTLTEAEGD